LCVVGVLVWVGVVYILLVVFFVWLGCCLLLCCDGRYGFVCVVVGLYLVWVGCVLCFVARLCSGLGLWWAGRRLCCVVAYYGVFVFWCAQFWLLRWCVGSFRCPLAL